MATISLKAELTPEQIVEAIGQLNHHDLEMITRQALLVQSKQKAVARYEREAQLLDVIFEKKSVTFRRKFERLRKKQRTQGLSEAEQAEYLTLTDEIEVANVRYVEALTSLAELRGVPLPQLMNELGIQAK